MTSHGACNSGSSLVLTIASLQRLKMEALIPTPADREVWSVIKFLNAQCTAVSGLWPHTTRRSTHLLQEFSWEVVNYHPPYSSDLAPSDFHLFLNLRNFCSISVSVFKMTERRRWVLRWFQSKRKTSTTQDTKADRILWQMSIPGVTMLKNSSILTVSVPINLFITFGFVSVNGPRENYFVDALCRFCLDFDSFKPDEIGKWWHMIFCQMSVTLFARILF